MKPVTSVGVAVALISVLAVTACRAKPDPPSVGREKEAALCAEKGNRWVNRASNGTRVEACLGADGGALWSIESPNPPFEIQAGYDNAGNGKVARYTNSEGAVGPVVVYRPDGRREETAVDEHHNMTTPYISRSADGSVASVRCYADAFISPVPPFNLVASDGTSPKATKDCGTNTMCTCPPWKPTAPSNADIGGGTQSGSGTLKTCLAACQAQGDNGSDERLVQQCITQCGDDVTCVSTCRLKSGGTTSDRCALDCANRYGLP